MLISAFSSCSSITDERDRRGLDFSFIKYWPQPESSNGLRLAVKDNIDMQGLVTSAGSEYLARNSPPATQDAACLALARERNVDIVGKTNLTEFTVTVSGKNRYFGTPVNRWDGKHKFIPGGSSSGSAVAVATGRADIAFGTDTGGSIRVPAACCGIYGLKTTFGLVSTKGVFPVSPKHLDTVGPMAKDIDHLVRGMDLLERGFAARYKDVVADQPMARHITIGRLYLNGTSSAIDKAIDDALTARGFDIVNINETFKRFKKSWEQAEKDGKQVALADAWANDWKYSDKKGVTADTKLVLAKGGNDRDKGYQEALKRKVAWQRDLRRVFKVVDFICVPTLQSLPPRFPFWSSSVEFEWLVFEMQNTVGVNFAGNPALAVPVAMPKRKKFTPMTSLQLVGRPFSEAELLNAGRILERKP